MSYILHQHINRFVPLTSAEFTDILPYFTTQTVKKKQNLLTDGKICRSNYFIEKGCLRMFFINNKGKEQTTQFAIENWWLADYTSYATQKPSQYYIQAVENSSVIWLEYTAQEQLLKKHPKMERYFRQIHQRAHAAAQHKIRILYSHTREEIYRNFINDFPHFAQRIPQYLLASYLGFTPEYLSEIRKKKLS